MPASNALVRMVLAAVLGALVGAGAVEYRHRSDVGAAVSTAGGTVEDARATGDLRRAGAPGVDEEALRAEVARLKANAPSQSHTMSDVGYHWTNLWFAGEKKN